MEGAHPLMFGVAFVLVASLVADSSPDALTAAEKSFATLTFVEERHTVAVLPVWQRV